MEDTKGMTRRQLIVSSAGAVIVGGVATALLGETATAQAAPAGRFQRAIYSSAEFATLHASATRPRIVSSLTSGFRASRYCTNAVISFSGGSF